ncbi:flagellar biosynthesis protein FlgK [Sphingomonas sp. Leaf407]|uniref:flagellar hook-associated protein FlgK n=1 Tax=unclassified Sphingomonas TaxID=196159 RepID=UPI0006FC3657|nr:MULTISPECIES: flagellar hook-associated protein FlgK [unclassified Sphingomonas]KQN39569.1 flagellar biosynthesis protein FlgK [Sphingomonas sp. Leaf42]KQT28846.1 flagellar biosynthesis protein FlgK [Sphingomonas sp. Leaf407]
MSDLLSIGASGVRAHQAALTTTSDNIANAATPGYVRRTATLTQVGGTSVRLGAGMGVAVSGIARAADSFRSAQVRAAGSDVARTETGMVWLDRIESALGGQALDERMGDFFNAGTALAADPSATAPRAAMLEAASGVAQAFSGTVRAIDSAIADLDTAAAADAAKLGELSSGLAKINEGLGRVSDGSAGQAQLLDQRDRLLEEMSGLTDVTTTFDSAGRASVRGGGADGALLVHGSDAAKIGYARNADGAVSFVSSRAGVESILTPTGGSLAGIAEGAARLGEARASITTLATEFVNGVNDVQGRGQDLAGKGGNPMFALETGGTIKAVLSDPAAIAAASPGKGTRDNGNLSKLADLRSTAKFETRTVALQAANGSALAARKTVAQAQGSIHDSAVAARDAASGVNLDAEAIDLMRFQQAYQASSRVIQVARETLDTLLQIR